MRDDDFCAKEGLMYTKDGWVYDNTQFIKHAWTDIETEDPDIWAETVDYPDQVESPSHYTIGEREAIDYMREMGVLEDYAAGNIFKYLYRYKYKDNPTGDLLKARRYIDILIEELKDAK